MLNFLGRRIASLIFTLLFVSIAVFFIIELPPGDYATRYVNMKRALGDSGFSAEEIENIRQLYGLDKPAPLRYVNWLLGMFKGDFGLAFKYNLPVFEVIGERAGFTAILAFLSIFLTYGLAIPLGIFCAMHKYSPGDYFFSTIAYIGLAVPGFLLALMLLYFSVTVLGISVGGLFSPEYINAPWSWGRFMDFLSHIWVAATVLAIGGTARIIRTVRATMLDEKSKLYVVAARARGVSGTRLLLRYPVRSALNPVVSTIGWELSKLISGSMVVALVLAIPDMGPLLLDALLSQDMYLAGTLLLLISILTIIGTFISDILLAVMDPRIRLAKGPL